MLKRDVARAVEDHLALGLVHEGIAGRDADRLIGGGEVHAGRLHGRQRLAQRQQIGGRQIVGHHLERRGGADPAGMQDAPAENPQHRQHPLENLTPAAGKDRNVAGRRAMHAARDRTIDGVGAAWPRRAPPAARISAASVVDISSQILPGPMPDRMPSAPSMTAADAAGDGRQVMIDLACFRPSARDFRRRPHLPARNGAAAASIEIPHDELDAVAQQRAGKLAAGMA